MGNTPGRTKVFGLILSGVTAFLGTGGLWASEALAQCDPIPGANGPDAVSVLNPVESEVFGCFNGIQAYSADGGVSNIGDAPLPGDTGTKHHAMMTQNLYRLANNHFEQIGMSWVKHDDWAGPSPSSTCGSGSLQCTFCPGTLGVGCQDTYAACLNSCQGPLGPRSQINPATGLWPAAPVSGTEPPRHCDASGADGAIACRLQVHQMDLVPDDQFFVEQQVITPDETSEETRNNNVFYIAAAVEFCDLNLCGLEI